MFIRKQFRRSRATSDKDYFISRVRSHSAASMFFYQMETMDLDLIIVLIRLASGDHLRRHMTNVLSCAQVTSEVASRPA